MSKEGDEIKRWTARRKAEAVMDIIKGESDLAHEIAHHVCGHKPETILSSSNGAILCNYNEEQEEEASWLGGCLQIPKDAAINSLFKGFNDDQIAERYIASKEMVRFRLNATGARRIHARSLARNTR